MAVTGAVLLVLAVLGAVLFPAFPYLRPVLVNVQTALQFLGAALLLGSRMTLALLFAQRFELLLQGIVPRAGRSSGLVMVHYLPSSYGERSFPSDRTSAPLPERGGPPCSLTVFPRRPPGRPERLFGTSR